MTVEQLPDEVRELVERYLERLRLSPDGLMITVDRREFERWLGRRVSSSLGGAYIFLRHLNRHAILINLPRIDPDQPRALEIVVAEELIHMRDWIDGERRRHARQGHDRIAYQVAELTGTSLEGVRSALLPVQRRPYRYVYSCPKCGTRVKRRRRGRWSCGRCAPQFDARFEMRIVEELQ
ncbi:MAG: hypothetical protein M3173_03960 [Chloroflexota bacterium]|nr:hypothetical protein [Chloroflexota bacterium]